jgi:propionate CoA-transferase
MMIALPHNSQRAAGVVLRVANRRCNFVVVRSFATTTTTTTDEKKHEHEHVHFASDFDLDLADKPSSSLLQYEIPQRLRQKVVCLEDAVSLVADGDTVAVCGFVAQGTYVVCAITSCVCVCVQCTVSHRSTTFTPWLHSVHTAGAPEAVLEALGKRYEETGSPSNLTILFGGGPGDWGKRGINHLAKTKENGPPMLRRTIGSHYGQIPLVAKLALENKVEAWTLPLGSISRMIRAQATHSPGHITNVGIGTYVDPDQSGGAANEAAMKSPLHEELVSRVQIQGNDNLLYKALPIQVALIRGTTADAQGNVSIEKESLKCDQMILAAAARNSGGIVIAQVRRLAATGSIPVRSVEIPGPLVDCVVVVDHKDHDTLHPMSYVQPENPCFTGLIKAPKDELTKMPLDIRKIIARRAFFYLVPNTVVNLGIGMPEGVAGIASEEGMLDYVTLSTEPGVFGGLPASGHSFGPSTNPEAIIETNQMFDFYDGGGLNMAFLGAAEISPKGDINVSRMSKDRLTGPGGFIDISQSTKRLCFLTPFTVKGLAIDIPGDGSLKIKQEGSVKKFVSKIYETTFSGDEAVRRGQTVYYVTERAVFRRSGAHPNIELVEIARGIDLQKDVLDLMDFAPAVSPDLKEMDGRIFKDAKMGVLAEMFGSMLERCTYHSAEHIMFLDMFGITVDNESDIMWVINGVRNILSPLVEKRGPVDMVVNYDGFDIRPGLEEEYSKRVKEELETKFYKTVKRFAGKAFKRALLGNKIDMSKWDMNDIHALFDKDGDGYISREELRDGLLKHFHIHLTQAQLGKCFPLSEDGAVAVDKQSFTDGIMEVLRTK